MLRDGEVAAGDLCAEFSISRPAVSRHLRVLREAGLVSVQERGRERLHRLETAPLERVQGWLDGFRDPWAHRLDALATEVHRTRRERRTDPPQSSDTQEATA